MPLKNEPIKITLTTNILGDQMIDLHLELDRNPKRRRTMKGRGRRRIFGQIDHGLRRQNAVDNVERERQNPFSHI